MEENWIGRWLYSMSKQSHSGNSMEFLKLGRAWEEADIWRAWQSLPAVPKNLPSGDTAVVWSSAPWWNSCAWRGRGRTSWVWGKRWKKGTNMDKLFKEVSKDVKRIHSSMLGCTFRPWSCKLPKNEKQEWENPAFCGPSRSQMLPVPSIAPAGAFFAELWDSKAVSAIFAAGLQSRHVKMNAIYSSMISMFRSFDGCYCLNFGQIMVKGFQRFKYLWVLNGCLPTLDPFVLCKNQPKRFGVVPNL